MAAPAENTVSALGKAGIAEAYSLLGAVITEIRVSQITILDALTQEEAFTDTVSEDFVVQLEAMPESYL